MIRAIVMTLTCLLLALRMTASELDVPALPADIPPPSTGDRDTLNLDLAGAYELALHRNLDLQVGRYDLAVAEEGILKQTGIFDAGLSLGVNGSFSKAPALTFLEGVGAGSATESRRTSFDLGVDQLLPTGTRLGLEASSRRDESNSGFYYLNPSWSSSLGASLTQPLLRGFGTTVNRSGIIIARNSRAQTAVGFGLQVVTTLQQVEQAYWDLVGAREAVAVQEQSLELANRLLDETRERVKVGTSPPIDIVTSDARVATRRRELIYARNAAGNAEDALKALLGFNLPEEWMLPITTIEPYEVETVTADLAEAIETAIANRPEVRQKELALEYQEHSLNVARNSVLPSLDLNASYRFSGIGGKGEFEDEDGNVIVVDGGFKDSMQMVTDFDFPGWTLGLTFAVPIGNHDARANLAQRRFELDKGRTELDALKQKIIHDVRRAVRALDDGAAAIEAAAAELSLARRNLEAEQTKFANGLSTNYQVLDIQEDLSTARLSELRSRIDYRKALLGYRVATGTLLGDLGVEIVDPSSPDIPHDYWKDVEWLQFSDLKHSAERVTTPAE